MLEADSTSVPTNINDDDQLEEDTERNPSGEIPHRPALVYQAALRVFAIDPVLAAWLNSSSSSPARTAEISVSITAGSLSLDGTTIPAFPFSNSMGLAPNLTDITTCPAGSVFHCPTSEPTPSKVVGR